MSNTIKSLFSMYLVCTVLKSDAAFRQMLHFEVRQVKNGKLNSPLSCMNFQYVPYHLELLAAAFAKWNSTAYLLQGGDTAPSFMSGLPLFHSRCLPTPKFYVSCLNVLTFQSLPVSFATLRNRERRKIFLAPCNCCKLSQDTITKLLQKRNIQNLLSPKTVPTLSKQQQQ